MRVNTRYINSTRGTHSLCFTLPPYLDQALHTIHDKTGFVTGPAGVIIAEHVGGDARVHQHIRVAHASVRPHAPLQLVSKVLQHRVLEALGEVGDVVGQSVKSVRVPTVQHRFEGLLRCLTFA